MKYFFPVVVVAGTIILYLLTRKDQNEDGSMTKKGWKKTWIGFGLIFLAIIAFITIDDLLLPK